jgi:hypothetical protein
MKAIKATITQTQTHEFSVEDINDIIAGALEGGINYWCKKAVIKKDTEGNYFNVSPEDQNKVEFASDVIGYDGTLILFDAESDDKWELTLEKVIKGIELHCTNIKRSLNDLIDSYDADDYDMIVQYAIFGKQIFC